MSKLFDSYLNKEKIISVTGLGYVGLPLALEFAKHFKVIGFDINVARVELMRKGIDPSKELDSNAFEGCDITFTSDVADLKQANFHIVGVPTDIDENKVPNLNPLLGASRSVASALKKGDYVVYESTVYPGCTEEDCVPILENISGLKAGVDFKFGYSPERIVPGDKVKTLTNILKIVSGNDEEALEMISEVYSTIIKAGLHKAESIKVAEAAKVIENTQRDINISLMNELAIIFDKMGIDTKAVIEAAGTKWNFHKYQPGLVGGHCISVDPFYLMHKAKQLGIDPQVIAAGRRVNDFIPSFIAKRIVQALIEQDKNPGKSKVLVMGITFKEDVADIRNSKVVDLVKELMDYSIHVHVIDPHGSPNELAHEYGITLIEEPMGLYDIIVLAVGHNEYIQMKPEDFQKLSKDEIYMFDIKGMKNPKEFKNYWRL
ncbi:nucleotide sugar dehydrogenase [Flavobacterium sp. ZE23DGlu08]|uniref:nucleotide sugar dehydrogenase n=1 Tax=Flavobacterium sp. ZE23DGlu08 TaxID=3059026 RepID=UPI00265F5EFC|nr:nucleotide sugar dehydrogenase [Flavobacterium sp. ZE23DGlu08]WKL45056.1 nucleotide sugar dehydrogenase [Flavobacterium sp. ZE23DGlu08]